jgi:uncharacterized delta-60 repeat protein
MKKIYAFLLCLIIYSAFGQEGIPIPGFNYTGVAVKQIARESNGNILVLTNDNSILRINPTTGTIIQTIPLPFAPMTIYGQNNGGILVGGSFTFTSGGFTHRTVVRYTAAGIFDPNFRCNMDSTGGSLEVQVITEQPGTDRILVGSARQSLQQTPPLHRLMSDGQVDTSFTTFNSTDLQTGGTAVFSIATYPNGEILIGGSFPTYLGQPRRNIARLTTAGGLTQYNLTGLLGPVTAIAIQSDNRILVGGTFVHEPTGKFNFLRTSNTGVVETNFPALSINEAHYINDIKIQTCGSKILISGGIARGIVRLNNADGSNDTTFNTGGTGFDINGANQVIIDPINNIFTCGGPTYNSIAVNQIVKLLGTATLTALPDAITLPIPQGSTTTSSLNVLANDKYNSAQATINNVDIQPALNPEIPGITFTYTTGVITIAPNTVPGTYVYTYTICPKSGTAAACGCKTTTATITIIAGPPLIKLVAVNDVFITSCIDGVAGGSGGNITTNDTMDGGPIDFNKVTVSITDNGGMQNVSVSTAGVLSIPANTPSGIYTVTYQICQKNAVNCATATVKICVNNGFNPGTGANNTIHAVVLQPDGKIIIGGEFTEYNGQKRNRIARLNFDLSLDESFDPYGVGFNGRVLAIALQGTNILVGGTFTATGEEVTPKAKHLLARVDSNGLIDDTFEHNFFSQSPTALKAISVNAIALYSRGDILIGGSFDKINNSTNKAKMARLNSQGLALTNFVSPFQEGKGEVNDIFITFGFGEVYVGGYELKFPGSIAEQKSVIMCKMSMSGVLDPNFTVGKVSQLGSYSVNSIAYTTEKIIIGGKFDNYNDVSIKNIAQIDPTTGALAATSVFNPGSSTDLFINAVAIDLNSGKIIIGGIFTQFNTNSAKKIARLNSDGSFDSSFNTGNGTPGTGLEHGILKIETYGVNALKIQADGRIVVGGRFLTFNGLQAKYITRLSQDNPVIQGRKNMYTEENVSKGISIYPNPSEGIFNIDFKGYDESKFDITIYNALGQLIHKASVTPQNTNQIDLTSFGAGSYFITLQNANETINKIVVKK